jgi:cytochrome bd-type quinol oxidase subunit 2
VAFAATSGLLAFCLGAALGNVVRGVPLKEDRSFFEPLWTDFQVGKQTGILNWYTLLVAATAVLALAAVGVYPYVVPGRDPALGLTVYEAAAPRSGLDLGTCWWIPGMLLACGYTFYVYTSLPAIVSVHDTPDHEEPLVVFAPPQEFPLSMRKRKRASRRAGQCRTPRWSYSGTLPMRRVQ